MIATDLDLTTIETHRITGRDTIHLVDLPAPYDEMRDLKCLMGRVVTLDGRRVLVRSALPSYRPPGPAALMIREIQ